MKEIKYDYSYFLIDDKTELPKEIQELINKSVEISSMAYAPYSLFNVGAAVLLNNGEIVCGNNQENVAYPSGICAERVALFYASAHYPEATVKAIAVCAFSEKFDPSKIPTPCGSCRQVMAEYETKGGQQIDVYMVSGKGEIMLVKGIDFLLPLMFKANLKNG
jgi:cytidine deaminase